MLTEFGVTMKNWTFTEGCTKDGRNTFTPHAHNHLPFVQVSLDGGTSSRDGGLGGGGGLRV